MILFDNTSLALWIFCKLNMWKTITWIAWILYNMDPYDTLKCDSRFDMCQLYLHCFAQGDLCTHHVFSVIQSISALGKERKTIFLISYESRYNFKTKSLIPNFSFLVSFARWTKHILRGLVPLRELMKENSTVGGLKSLYVNLIHSWPNDVHNNVQPGYAPKYFTCPWDNHNICSLVVLFPKSSKESRLKLVMNISSCIQCVTMTPTRQRRG